jgi:hypothetical protein
MLDYKSIQRNDSAEIETRLKVEALEYVPQHTYLGQLISFQDNSVEHAQEPRVYADTKTWRQGKPPWNPAYSRSYYTGPKHGHSPKG